MHTLEITTPDSTTLRHVDDRDKAIETARDIAFDGFTNGVDTHVSVTDKTGAEIAVFRGGHNAVTGLQSVIRVNSIIGTRGVPNINPFLLRPGLTNGKLFVRDRNVCAYCGGHFHETDLTREHIIPFAQQGVDTWMNVVTACRPCNHRKSHRTPEQAHMPLLYAPYVPSLWEDFILRNRRILADQMEFLMSHVPRSSRLLA